MDDQNTQPYKLPADDQTLTATDVVNIVNSMLTNLNTATKLSNGFIQSQNFIHGSAGWQLTDSSAEFNVGVSVQSINIPDTTTANSFHVDTSGNAWWGANVATGYAGANAYVLANGGAIFKNVQIGGTTIQYVITNSGIFSYGDGSDGTATCDGSTAVAGMTRSSSTYTMTRDVYFNSLTINNGVTLLPNGYRLFVSNTLTNAGIIDRSGNAGTAGNQGSCDGAGNPIGGSGGTGGAALADGYLKGSAAGQNGATAINGPGPAGTGGSSTSNSVGLSGASGGDGGKEGLTNAAGGSGGTGGTATLSNVKLIANWHLATLLDITSTGATIKFNNSAGTGSGGAGATGGNTTFHTASRGGGGGGSGSPGGIMAIYARNIVNTGTISANGGVGGVGGKSGPNDVGANTYGGGGGGGGGGNGGVIIMTYNSLTNSGSIVANAGAGGTGGASGGLTGAVAGTNGTNGSAGTINQFQLSL